MGEAKESVLHILPDQVFLNILSMLRDLDWLYNPENDPHDYYYCQICLLFANGQCPTQNEPVPQCLNCEYALADLATIRHNLKHYQIPLNLEEPEHPFTLDQSTHYTGVLQPDREPRVTLTFMTRGKSKRFGVWENDYGVVALYMSKYFTDGREE